MSFMNNYPTSKTKEEEEMEIKIKLKALIRTALKKTANERTEGLKLTDEQIEKIVSMVEKLEIDRSKSLSIISLEGIIDTVLEGSNDPEIKLIQAQQSEIYRKKQQAFEQSEEYAVAQELYKTHRGVMGKIMKELGVASILKEKDGTIKISTWCDEANFISSKYDQAALCIENGTVTIETEEPDNSEKLLQDR